MFSRAELGEGVSWLIEMDMHVSRVEEGIVERSCI
jgi:hypothetical protein